jgi:hypothetical protein
MHVHIMEINHDIIVNISKAKYFVYIYNKVSSSTKMWSMMYKIGFLAPDNTYMISSTK